MPGVKLTMKHSALGPALDYGICTNVLDQPCFLIVSSFLPKYYKSMKFTIDGRGNLILSVSVYIYLSISNYVG